MAVEARIRRMGGSTIISIVTGCPLTFLRERVSKGLRVGEILTRGSRR